MTTTKVPTTTMRRLGGRWIDDWRPEEEYAGGRRPLSLAQVLH